MAPTPDEPHTYRIRDWYTLYENNRSRELKHLEWVLVPNRMDTDGYTEFVDHPNAAAHLGCWIAILQIASRREVRGSLPQCDAGLSHALARISRLPAGLFNEVIPRLLKIKWIEQLGEIPHDDAIIPHVSAEKSRLKGREGKGTEGNGMELIPPLPLAGSAALKLEFETNFWTVVWLRVGRGDAEKAYMKQRKAGYLSEQICGAAEKQGPLLIQAAQLRGSGVLHPATWLNGKRFLDEDASKDLPTNGNGHGHKPLNFQDEEARRNRLAMQRSREQRAREGIV